MGKIIQDAVQAKSATLAKCPAASDDAMRASYSGGYWEWTVPERL